MVKIRRTMDEFFHLRLGGGNYARMVMTGVDDGDPGKTVEVLAAIFVPHFDAAGVIDDDRRNRLYKAGHYVVFVFLDRVGHAPLNLRALTSKDTLRLRSGQASFHEDIKTCASGR